MRSRPPRRTGHRAGWRLVSAALVLALTAGHVSAPAAHVSAPAAHAEVEHPRQQWLRNPTAGLFLHWGMYTSPVLTTFHSRLGYARP